MCERKHPYAKCEQCSLRDTHYIPSTPASGDLRLIVIGDEPQEDDISTKNTLSGQCGKLIAQCVLKAGQPVTGVARYNLVACRATNHDENGLTQQAIECCAPRLEYELSQLPLDIPILVLGKETNAHFLRISNEDTKMKMSERTGAWFKWNSHRWIATLHPSYILKNPADAPLFLTHVKRAFEPVKRSEKEPDVIHISSYEELVAACEKIADDTWVSFDIETDSLNWYERPGIPKDSILVLGFTPSYDYGYAIEPDILYDDDRVVPYLDTFFNRVRLCAHNGKFDTLFLHTGIKLPFPKRFEFDTQVAHYTLDERPGFQDLKQLAFEEFGIPNYEERIIKKYLKSQRDYYSKIPYDKLCLYMTWDTVVTLRLRELYEKRMRSVKLNYRSDSTLYDWPFMNLLMPAQRALAQVELNGVPVDVKYLKAQTERMRIEMEQYHASFCKLVGRDINLNSAPQKAALFFDELKLPDCGVEGAKSPNIVSKRSTSKAAILATQTRLQELGMYTRFHADLFASLAKYQRVKKMISSYAENILSRVSIKGDVHASYKIHGAETGRLSAVDPAIQTIPRPDDRYGAIIRSAFVAPVGYKFVIVDYSQGELRCAAALSGDDFLLNVYRQGRDLHSEVAAAMYGPHYTKAQRVICKMFNFAYLYGGSEYSFAASAGLPIETARRFISDYNSVMRGLSTWKRQMISFARRNAYVENIFGRRRRFPVLRSKALDEELTKAAVNMPVQSALSDLNLIAGTRMVNDGYKLSILVHDSLVFLCRDEEAQHVADKAQKTMVDVGSEFLPQVVWKADAEIVSRWAQTPADFVRSFIQPGKIEDDYELGILHTWLNGEEIAMQHVKDAIADPILAHRIAHINLASECLRV